MDQWVPLFVAIVGAVAAVSVAFWNSRGESAELRQLKGMNEVIGGLPESAPGAQQFTEARNDLLIRVARRVKSAPLRRNVAITLASGVVAIAASAWVFATYVPTLTTEEASTLGNALVLLVAIAALGMAWLSLIDTAKAVRKRRRGRRRRDEE